MSLVCIIVEMYIFFFFFFQAEDGIRDLTVTGVQTCALPIFKPASYDPRLTPPLIVRRTDTRCVSRGSCPLATLASKRSAQLYRTGRRARTGSSYHSWECSFLGRPIPQATKRARAPLSHVA